MDANAAKRYRTAEHKMHKVHKAQKVQNLSRRLLPLLIAGCFGPVLANPIGPQVVNGQASFSQQGNLLSITNTPGAIINWQDFSIGAGEITRFIQQSANSSVLNRVIGQDPSQILGALQSNGRVFLVNPNGILFGAGAQIDVNGLVASTLNISNEDFLNGNMRFNADGSVGDLKNEGTIRTPDGGQVYLIAPNVENTGVITSPKGEVLLAAGHSVQLVDSANPDLHVVVSASDNEAVNLGEIVAQGGKLGIYGALVRQGGIVSADSAVVGENGKIVFKASGDTLLEAGSRTTATGAGSGGEIHILGERVGLTGDAVVDASGQTGGGTVLVGGDYQGKNEQIANAEYTYVGKDARISADAIQNGDGGKVIVWGDRATRAYGQVFARGGAESGNGGFVEISGKEYLDYHGMTDLRAANGNTGTLLLDPANIVIQGGVGDGDAGADTTGFGTVTPGSIFAAEIGPSTVYQSEIQAQSATADIVLDASNSITTSGSFIGGAVTLASGSDLTLRTRNSISLADGGTGIDLTGSAHGSSLEFKTQGGGAITIEGGYDASPEAVAVRVGRLSSDVGAISVKSSGTLDIANTIMTNSGAITLSSDNINLAGNINSVAGAVHLQAAKGTTAIELGGTVTDTTGVLGLSNDELNRISTGNELRIGAGIASGNMAVMQTLDLTTGGLSGKLVLDAGTGNLTIGQSVHAPGTLVLLTGGAITQSTGAAISATSLKAVGATVTLDQAANPVGVIAGSATSGDFRYRTSSKLTVSTVDGDVGINAAGNVVLQSSHAEGVNQMEGSGITAAGGLAVKAMGPVMLGDDGNNVATLAAQVDSASSPFEFHNINDLTVGSVDNINGITTSNGDVRLSTGPNKTLTISQAVQAGTGEVDLKADNLQLNGTVAASMVSIQPYSIGRAMTIGAACFTSPCLSVTDLYRINATTIGLGHEDYSGGIHVAGISYSGGTLDSDRNAATTRIGLLTTGDIAQSGGINVTQLGIDAGGNVNLSLANSVTDLAAHTVGGDFSFRNSGSLNVSTIDGADYGDDYLLSGISTMNGDVALTVDSGDINVATAINAGTGNVVLTASAGAIAGSGGINGHELNASAANGINLKTSVDALRADNTGAASDIIIANASPLTLYGISQSSTGSTGNIAISSAGALTVAADTVVSARRGAISMTAQGPLTVDGLVSTDATTAGEGNVTLWAQGNGVPGTGVLTINESVTTNAGNIALKAGDSIVGADKAISLAGSVTSTSNLNLPSSIVTPETDIRASNLIQTSIAAADTSTTATTTAAAEDRLASSTPDTVNEQSAGEGATEKQIEKQTEEQAGERTDGADADNAEDDGAKQNEPAQKLYCN